MGLTYEEVEVTPTLAREWLSNMASNRHVSENNVVKLKKAMANGGWHDDGTPIRFNTEGQLIDGQHRLTALAETGRTLKMLVVKGVPHEAMATMDTGKTRNPADIIGIHFPGTVDLNSSASVATIALRWTKGHRLTTMRNALLSNDELLEFFGDNQSALQEAARIGRRVGGKLQGMTPQAFALCAYLFNGIDQDDADFFWQRCIDGKGLEDGSPILALRELNIREAKSSRPRMRVDFGVAFIIKAWNAFREGRDVKVLTYRAGGANPERFPEPV